MDGILMERLEASMRAGAGEPATPKYVRLSDAFERMIRAGEVGPGARIPTETELAARLPVSLGTLQRALARLAERGLVVRQRRAGTFVADRGSQVSEVHLYRFRDPVTGAVLMPFVRAIAVETETSDGPWRAFFGADRIVRFDRLLSVGDDPPAFSSVFLPELLGRYLLEEPLEAFDGASCHEVLARRFGRPTLRIEHRVTGQELSERARTHLALPAGTGGLVWDAMDRSFGDEPVMFQRLELPPGHRPMEIAEAVG